MSPPPEDRYDIQGRRLVCPHCEGQLFERTPVYAVPQLRLGNVLRVPLPAVVFRCVGCGRLEWFVEEVLVEAAAEVITCLQCGAPIAEGAPACTTCGWTWHTEAEPDEEVAAAEDEDDELPTDDAEGGNEATERSAWRCRRCGKVTYVEASVCQACGGRIEAIPPPDGDA